MVVAKFLPQSDLLFSASNSPSSETLFVFLNRNDGSVKETFYLDDMELKRYQLKQDSVVIQDNHLIIAMSDSSDQLCICKLQINPLQLLSFKVSTSILGEFNSVIFRKES